MKTNRIAALASLLSLALAGCATHKTDKAEAWGGTVVGQLNKQAVVQKVDYRTREVTVKEEAGETTTVVAGPLVRNFNQIKPGDKVSVQYQESVTILGMSGVGAVPARAESVDVARAPLGEKPAGVIVQTGEAIAEVVAINHKDRTVTLKGPLRILIVEVDKNVTGFDRLKKGDKVYLRSTAALAVAVTAE
jgi:Cu/Ag efflux protein CusF